MKKIILICIAITLLLISSLYLITLIKIDKDNKIMYISLSDDISEYDEITCYDDGMSYYKDKDITITGIDIDKKFIFYLVTLEYKEGNLCATEFQLEESYIQDFINNAEIIYNEKNINIKNLIEGKQAIIENKRYSGNDYETFINYKLNGRYEIMYIFYVEDLLIIQVGYSDEGPKFVAYK